MTCTEADGAVATIGAGAPALDAELCMTETGGSGSDGSEICGVDVGSNEAGVDACVFVLAACIMPAKPKK